VYTIIDGQSPTGSVSSGSGSFTLSASGLFVADVPSSLGYVNPDKNLVIATQTQLEGSVTTWALILLLKK
jgi:hypothetical protein